MLQSVAVNAIANAAVPQAAHEHNAGKVRNAELLISNLLRAGVIVSFCVVMLGIIAMFCASGPGAGLAQLTASGAQFPHTLSAILTGLAAFNGQAIVMLGLGLLIATPVLRVAISVFVFLYQRDRTYVTITLIVLALLVTSLFLGRAEKADSTLLTTADAEAHRGRN